MHVEDVDLDTVWKRPPGSIPRWCSAAIVLACLASVAIAAGGMRAMWTIAGCNAHFESWWFRDGIAFSIAACVALAYMPAFRVARLVRVVVVLPAIHLATLVAIEVSWLVLRDHKLAVHEVRLDPLVPPLLAFVAGGVLLGVIARALNRREWLHTCLMLTLAFVLALGLWIPILSALSTDGAPNESVAGLRVLRNAADLLAIAIAPPLLAAIAYVRFPSLRRAAKLVVVLLIVVATEALAKAKLPTLIVAINLVHLELIALALALVMLVLAAVVTWRAMRRRLPNAEPGRVICEDGVAAELEIASWLRGPRLWTRPFVIATSRGELPVTTADVLAHIPIGTTRLSVGERAPVLRDGDLVTVATRTRGADHPFRAMPMTTHIAIATAHSHGVLDVALALWRPCVAYLAIVIAVLVPTLAFLVGAVSPPP